MIPLYLSISGFLSYRERAEIDFTPFDLACISGANGAGKSSLLDAITWVLFGQARKRDDSVINSQSDCAIVHLDFAYEGNIYRVQRTKPRDKAAILEFQILQEGEVRSGLWKPLTERALRETEAAIQRTLRLDYDTFVNASFFLQGKADQFTQHKPPDRKRILSSILGLEIWEEYKRQAADQRKDVELQSARLEGFLREIAQELAQEEPRRQRLQMLEGELQRLGAQRAEQEKALQGIRRIVAVLDQQRKLVEHLGQALEGATRRNEELARLLESRNKDQLSLVETLGHADEIEQRYADWQAARAELEDWEASAARFREHEKLRAGPRDQINAEQARLAQEMQTLETEQAQLQVEAQELEGLQSRLKQVQLEVLVAEGKLERRQKLDETLQAARERQIQARAENQRLKPEMDVLKERIDRLQESEGAVCPLCGQPLNHHDRQQLVEELNTHGREAGDRYRANLNLLKEAEEEIHELNAQIMELSQVELDLRRLTQNQVQVAGRMELLQARQAAWQEQGQCRLEEVGNILQAETYAPEARHRLAQIDAQLKEIGYDAAAHDLVRRTETERRAAEVELRELERARATVEALQREIGALAEQSAALSHEVGRQQADYDQAVEALAAAEAQAPDLNAAENLLFSLKERENEARTEVGAARQAVLVLEDQKGRQKQMEAERQELVTRAGYYKQLEKAFSKDGVPALLIEQALPMIEERANEVLDRLSDGQMWVRFVTQSAFKDKKRDDLKETLDIQISDGLGARDYEMFSGGEAFRVNFAIRLALSEVLAQRAGARLQTLVIDEGFGSQDAEGRQRLVEAINLVKADFAKILVITHIDELKDHFPTRIEVEKTPLGSVVHVN